jgi:hypothetical protein
MSLHYQILIEQYPERPYCQTHGLSTSRHNYYCLDDGTRVPLSITPVWCRRCRKFTLGEWIESMAEIEDRVAEYSRWELSDQRTKIMERLERRKRWRSQRRSPARCLRCFTTDIFVFPIGEHVRHPGGKGWVTVRIAGFIEPSKSEEWLLDADGNPLNPVAS